MTDATQHNPFSENSHTSASPNVGTFAEKVDLGRTDAPGMENDDGAE